MDQEQHKVLIVEGNPTVRRLLCRLLSRNYLVREVTTGADTLQSIESWTPQLVLMDTTMPGIDGYEVCRCVKALSSGDVPQVVMMSVKSDPEELARVFEVGADDYLVKPVDPLELWARVEMHVRLYESRTAAATLQRQVDSHCRSLNYLAAEGAENLIAVQDVAVFTLAKVAEVRDHSTGQHIFRLREYAQRLALELKCDPAYASIIDEGMLADLYRSSPLHDIGKVGIPDSILLKTERLTAQEFEVMKRHAIIGANMLLDAVMQLHGGGFLSMAAVIAQFHHERWDGGGYPAGLAGDEIPLPARIVSVADVYDALTSERPYKQAWSSDRAKQTIDEGAGTLFDPAIVKAFDRCYTDIQQIQSAYADRHPTVVGAMAFAEYGPLVFA